MVEPVVIPRAQHTLSRRDIDPDALKVLYRLRQAGYRAYLVGGSVRDLLLGRRPKDFDVGTDAHPYQIKKLFRNCWIIGRRFRLAHVKFGAKTIEVATFRRAIVPGTEGEPPLPHDHGVEGNEGSLRTGGDGHGRRTDAPREGRDHPLHRDNTFGTAEEDAFRRDFTINALFYDIASFSVIDYVGGLADLQNGVIRCIGDPEVRFREDPVRMLRAIVFRARLDFELDPAVGEAITGLRNEIAKSAPARLLEEYYKILRSGAAARTFGELGRWGLLATISPQVAFPVRDALQRSLEALDTYRRRFPAVPEALTTPVLLGSLIFPLGLMRTRPRRRGDAPDVDLRQTPATLGLLPVPRRDLERLAQIVSLQRRLKDLEAPLRAKASLMHRHSFADALTWLEIHGDAPAAVAHWQELLASGEAPRRTHEETQAADQGVLPRWRRRRRRRRPDTEP